MSVNVLDTILNTYISILNGGFAGLIPIGLAILGVLAVLELRLGFLYATLDGYVDWVKLFGLAFMPLLTFAILAYLIQSAATWSNEALQMFLHWGSQVASVHIGNTPLTSALSSPTSLWEFGFQLAYPLYQFITSPWNQVTGSTFVLLTYWMSYMFTVIFFGLMALHVMMALIEFKVAGLLAIPFIAWGALSQARFLMWGAFAYIAAVGARLFVLVMLLSGAVVAIFMWTPLQVNASADATWTQALVLGFGSLVLFVITYTLPSLAAGRIAGGGGGLGIGGLLAVGMVGMTTIRAGSHVVRGVSNLVR